MSKENGIMKAETYWAITGVHGLYVGTWYTRKEAVSFHIRAKGKDWGYCRKLGDRAIKVKVIPLPLQF